MGNLTDTEKINYISNNFHQYFDITLNTNITQVESSEEEEEDGSKKVTTESVNLVIPIDSLQDSELPHTKIYSHDISITDDFDIDEFLSEIEDTTIQPNTQQCYCTEVVDGDTFYVKIFLGLDSENKPIFEERKVRLVGVDAPEMHYYYENGERYADPDQGAEDSKRFLEKVCYTKTYYNKLHSGLYEENKDGTLTANDESEVYKNNKKIYLHIDQTKSIDKYDRTLAVLIVNNKNINQCMLKKGIAQIMYIPPCEFNSFEWGDATTESSLYYFNNDDLNCLSQYFNSDMTNVVFTPQDDYTKIYRYEVYKNVFYIKLNPYSMSIRMHLLPKAYNCSNSVLLLRDNMLERRTINVGTASDYRINEEKGINAYYQINSVDRNRDNIPVAERDFNPNNFNNTYCEFDYDVADLTENLRKLMICVGYRYNKTSPYYSIHYTGVKDNHSKPIEERCTLIDANWDTILDETKTNYITQMEYRDTDIFPPQHNRISIEKSVLEDAYASIPHTENIGRLYHKKLKYINDDLYAEEEFNSVISHDFAEWRNVIIDNEE